MKKSILGKSNRLRIFVCLSLVFGMFILYACSSVESIPADNQAVLQGMRNAGFEFDSTLVKITIDENQQNATVTGPMVGLKEIPGLGTPAPEKGGTNFIEYSKVQLEWQNNQWVVNSAVVKQ